AFKLSCEFDVAFPLQATIKEAIAIIPIKFFISLNFDLLILIGNYHR
ncbi:MAG: hypothetical protein JWQ25_3174, partial [Daejeonella sp.]|nr:hypothetical protein [Daejeonella sp.]